MHPTSLLSPLAAVVIGALTQASMTPASPAPAASVQQVALLRPVTLQGMAETPGCAQSAPLFRSVMPSRIAWHAAGDKAPADAAPAEAEPEPAMHQALHLCVVETFNPRRAFSGASKAVYRL
jgi:hypothetical protein